VPDRIKVSANSALRYASLGLELVGAVLGFALGGLWFDRSFETSPWGILIGLTLGIIGGLYNLIRAARQAILPGAVDQEVDKE
jgi:F0F1-type ATP synthase assembly protein I